MNPLFQDSPNGSQKKGIYVSEEDEPRTSQCAFHHSNDIWLRSSQITSFSTEKSWVKDPNVQRRKSACVLICLEKEVIQLADKKKYLIYLNHD